MTPYPLPSKWIPWGVAALAVIALALTCHPSPTRSTHALTVAHDSTVHAVASMDSVRSRVKIARAQSNIRVKTLAPLRERVTLTPNAVLVDGQDTLTGPGVGVIGKVIASQDTVIQALGHTVAVQDTALVADSLALQASLHETTVARSLIPSRWTQVKTATKWGVIGGAVALLVHAVLTR